MQDRALAEIGGKALWTKELDRALLDGEIDIAVHSMKDVETIRPEAIMIAAMLRARRRARPAGRRRQPGRDPRRAAWSARRSPRRRAQVLRARPDLSVVLFRGNVDTRLAKLAAGEADATLLAAAGLIRLGRDDVGVAVALDEMLPAPAQGAVGIECRADDAMTRGLLGKIDHADTSRAVRCERALLAALDATCHSPVAALATIDGDTVTLRAELFSEDGAEHVAGRRERPRRRGAGARSRPRACSTARRRRSAPGSADEPRGRGAAARAGQCRDRRAGRSRRADRDPPAVVRGARSSIGRRPIPPRSTR